MKYITDIEKNLPPKRKTLLYNLRKNNWEVVKISNDFSDWIYDEKWIVESTRENKGFQIQLWFFKHNGLHDGVDNVQFTKIDDEMPNPYGERENSIYFDGRKFEYQLGSFLENIHILRCINKNEKNDLERTKNKQ